MGLGEMLELIELDDTPRDTSTQPMRRDSPRVSKCGPRTAALAALGVR